MTCWIPSNCRFYFLFALTLSVVIGPVADADASVLLITLADGTASTHDQLDSDMPQVWPWNSAPQPQDELPARPTVILAPEMSLGEAGSQVREIAATLTSDVLAWGQRISDWTKNRAESALASFNNSETANAECEWNQRIAADRPTLEEARTAATATPLDAAPQVATLVHIPAACHPLCMWSVDDLSARSRNMLSAAGLDTPGIFGALSSVWPWPMTIAPAIDATVEADAAADGEAVADEQPGEYPFEAQAAGATSVPLSAISRPLLRQAAATLFQAGASLQALSARLEALGGASDMADDGQPADATGLADDPAARSYFED